jgi:pimeloyl-ACP methyl ester carboxylesterase
MLKPMASCIVCISRRAARALVCLHTAGSDGRQWRHLLADEELAKKFRIIAFDMPWHGKSNPPARNIGCFI